MPLLPAEKSTHRIYNTISSYLAWFRGYDTSIPFQQSWFSTRLTIERSPVLQSSSIAESVWNMRGINITCLAITPNTYELYQKLCQVVKTLRRQYYCAGSKRGPHCSTPGEWIWKVWNKASNTYMVEWEPVPFTDSTLMHGPNPELKSSALFDSGGTELFVLYLPSLLCPSAQRHMG